MLFTAHCTMNVQPKTIIFSLMQKINILFISLYSNVEGNTHVTTSNIVPTLIKTRREMLHCVIVAQRVDCIIVCVMYD